MAQRPTITIEIVENHLKSSYCFVFVFDISGSKGFVVSLPIQRSSFRKTTMIENMLLQGKGNILKQGCWSNPGKSWSVTHLQVPQSLAGFVE